jgi:hypothetical protein
MTHTPGPWVSTRQRGAKVTGPDRKSICCIPATVSRPREESDANARLIAAAPDLMAALQAIMDCSKKSGIPGTTSAWYEFGEATANIASAALAKAAG